MYGELPKETGENGNADFHVILYTPSGYTEGVEPCRMSDLSHTWVEFWCEAFRDLPQFDHDLPAPFDPVRLRYHTDGNIGVADFFFKGAFVLTSVMLRGQDLEEEKNLVASLADLAREQQKQAGFKVTGFEEAINATERPLHIVFLRTYERDPMVPELVNHLAGAFMQGFEV